MKKALALFCIALLLGACEQKKSEHQVLNSSDSLRKYSTEILGTNTGWIMMSRPGICWICNGYYYYLGKEIQKQSPTKLILLTHKFRKPAKEEMYDGLGWTFGENILHKEDPEAYKKLAEFAGGEGKLIHITSDSIYLYPIDDRDAMDTLWPEIKKIIQEGN